MSALDILYRYAGQQGWSNDALLALACNYIDNQASPDVFEDFIAQAVIEESNWGTNREEDDLDERIFATAEGEQYRVVFEYAGDRDTGRRSPDAPADSTLLRLSVLTLVDAENNAWEEIEDDSWCTTISTGASRDNLDLLAAKVLRAVETVAGLHGSPGDLAEELGASVYVGITQFEIDLVVADVLRSCHDSRYLLPIVEPASDAMRVVFASTMRSGSVAVAISGKDETQAGVWVHFEGGLYARPEDQAPSPVERDLYARQAAGRAAKGYPTVAMLYLESWEGLRTVGFVDTRSWSVSWL